MGQNECLMGLHGTAACRKSIDSNGPVPLANFNNLLKVPVLWTTISLLASCLNRGDSN
jgi:hypothetical protein